MSEFITGQFKPGIDIVMGGLVMTSHCDDFIIYEIDNVYQSVVSVKDVGTSSLSMANGAIDLTGIGEINTKRTQIRFVLSKETVDKGILSGQFQIRKN